MQYTTEKLQELRSRLQVSEMKQTGIAERLEECEAYLSDKQGQLNSAPSKDTPPKSILKPFKK